MTTAPLRIYAVIPAHNEASRIAATVAAVLPFVSQVLVVDDGSRDETGAVASAAGATVVRHVINRGQGAALRTGTRAALARAADVVVHLDADGQHVPAYIADLVRPLAAGAADVVFGSRFMGVQSVGMPAHRLWTLRLARVFSRYALGLPARLTDPQSGMRAMTSAAAGKVRFVQDRMAHCSEILRMVTRSDLRWQEVPIEVRYSAETLAKGQSFWDSFKILWQLMSGGLR